MKLIGLAGAARSGKDTVAMYLWEHCDVYAVGYADALKAAAAVLLNRTEDQMNGFDSFDREAILPEWGFTTRDFLQKLGTECMRDVIRKDFWINRVKVEIEGKSQVVVTDVRFENEADFIREQGGHIWHIYRPDPNGLNAEAQAHASEAGVAMVHGDRVIKNRGTLQDLEKQVIELWTSYE